MDTKKPKVTYALVADTCKDIYEETGKTPTMESVYKEVGGHRATVHEMWKRWKEENGLLKKSARHDIPGFLLDSLKAGLAKVREEEFAFAEEQIADITEEVKFFKGQVNVTEAQVEDLKSLLLEKDCKISDLEKKLTAEQALKQQKEENIEKLESKQASAQESLIRCQQELEYLKSVNSQFVSADEDLRKMLAEQASSLSNLRDNNIHLEKENSAQNEKNVELRSQLKSAILKKESLMEENSELKARLTTSELIKRVEELEQKLKSKEANQQEEVALD